MPSTHKQRYDEVADTLGCFAPERRDRLRSMPLQQIWRDHLLAGVVRRVDKFDDGFFAFLYPAGNAHCAEAVERYRGCLTCHDTFADWTVEGIVQALRSHTDAKWVGLFEERYLAFKMVDDALRGEGGGGRS